MLWENRQIIFRSNFHIVGFIEVQYKQIAIKPRDYVMKILIFVLKSNLLESVINRLVSSANRTILLFLVIIFGRSFI